MRVDTYIKALPKLISTGIAYRCGVDYTQSDIQRDIIYGELDYKGQQPGPITPWLATRLKAQEIREIILGRGCDSFHFAWRDSIQRYLRERKSNG
jgi:hypothetical protein